METGKGVNTKYFINSAVVVILMFFFRFIPPFGSMTSLGMAVLGIFLGALWGWINCDMIWPSILAITMLGFTSQYENVAAAFTAVISNSILQQILWLLVFSAILTVTGISDQLANRLVTSKMCKGRPWVLSIVIYVASLICSSFGAAFAAMLICWDFIYTICKQVGYTKEDTWPKMMIVGVVFASCVGTVGMPFQAGVAATFGYLSAASEGLYASYNYLQYLIFSLVMCVTSTALFFLLCKLILRPDMSRLKETVSVGNVTAFNQRQKFAVGALVALIVLTILPSCLPSGAFKDFLDQIGTTAFVLIIVGTITIFRTKDGKPIFTFKELADAGIFWNMLFMVGTAVTVGTVLATGDTGFTTTLMAVFTPMFAGKSPILFAIVICLVTLVLTNLINNAVAGAIMVPVMYSFAAQIGVNPLMLTAVICFVSDIGMLLPCASPSGAMLYSNKEWLETKDIVKYSLVGILTMAIIAVCIGIPFGTMIFS
ncbi:MAG: hypothetical protein LUE24_07385 [Lachnospiraceae bacterium]|nr:hypothetical protein [Lachnospiraceae bacterium]